MNKAPWQGVSSYQLINALDKAQLLPTPNIIILVEELNNYLKHNNYENSNLNNNDASIS
jgi:hypothetical protein